MGACLGWGWIVRRDGCETWVGGLICGQVFVDGRVLWCIYQGDETFLSAMFFLISVVSTLRVTTRRRSVNFYFYIHLGVKYGFHYTSRTRLDAFLA